MKIGTSLALVAAGLIFAYAVEFDVPGVDIQTMGSILFFIGLLGLIVTVGLEVNALRAHRPPKPRRERAPDPRPRERPPERWEPVVPHKPRPRPRDPASEETRVIRDPPDDRTRRM